MRGNLTSDKGKSAAKQLTVHRLIPECYRRTIFSMTEISRLDEACSRSFIRDFQMLRSRQYRKTGTCFSIV